MDKLREDPNARVLEIIKDKELPHFIRYAAERALLSTPVEAANGFTLLSDVFIKRAEDIHGIKLPVWKGADVVDITEAGAAELHRLRVAAGEIPPDHTSPEVA